MEGKANNSLGKENPQPNMQYFSFQSRQYYATLSVHQDQS
jgi:hypothetical protein